MITPNYIEAEAEIDKSIQEIKRRAPRYHAYFETLRPQTDADFFRRGLFAFASVHTTWEKNCDLFQALRDYPAWMGNDAELTARIIASRAGLHQLRTKFISEYAEKFWARPQYWRRLPDEYWGEYRKRIQSLNGLGPAKSSFFVELTYFHDSQTVCMDTHMLQQYGLKASGSTTGPAYAAIEKHWLAVCAARGVPPVTVRWCLWDMKQKKADSSYWAHVLETGRGVQLQMEWA